MHEFRECSACRAKPGAPVLCESCLHNRQVISELQQQLKAMTTRLDEDQREQRDSFRRQYDWLIQELKRNMTSWRSNG